MKYRFDFQIQIFKFLTIMNNTYITYIIFMFQTLFKNVLKSFKVLFDKVAKKNLLLNQHP